MNRKTSYQKIRHSFHKHPRLNPKSFTFDRAFRTLTSPWRLLPNFIIIGYHKAGTSSLYDYLNMHPNIGAAATKEVHFFDYQFSRKIGWYREQFPQNKDKKIFEKNKQEKFITGEASPDYILHPLVPRRIKEILSTVKLLILLRNPIDRSYSHYQHDKRRGIDPAKTFEEVISDDDNRLKIMEKKFSNDEINTYNLNEILFPYISASKYIIHINEWMKVFSKTQVLFLLTSDLEQFPQTTMDKICKFLDIPYYKFTNFKKSNVGNYELMNQKTRDELIDIFKPYNKKLEKFLGRILNWDN